jgi:hypothetical protein
MSLVALCCAAAAPTTNPADLYSQAFARLKAEQANLSPLDEAAAAPLDEATAKFLAGQQDVVTLLRLAARMGPASWPAEQGDIQPVLDSLNYARSAAKLMLLEARSDLKENKPTQVADDVVAAIAVGRNIATRHLILCSLVDAGIESMAIDVLAVMLPSLPKDVVANLPAKLAAIPKPLSGKDLMAGEFEFGKAASANQNVPPAIFEAAEPFYKAVGEAMTQPSSQFDETIQLNLPESG